MDLRQHMRLMSDWHVWASDKLYAVVDGLTDEEYRRDAGLFFKSVHRSLNHLLLIEQLWRGRLAGPPLQFKTLGDELVTDRAALRARFFESARSWRPFVDAMTDADLATDFTFTSSRGTSYTLPRASIVHTIFTHGSHHRGQITAVLTQLGKPAPEMDFPYFLGELPREQLHGA